jgi:hypothetical protein
MDVGCATYSVRLAMDVRCARETGYGCALCDVQRETGYGCALCDVQRETGYGSRGSILVMFASS